ncbi:MAG TPA: hypothetical protein VJY39_14625 [Acidisphaera sp.]|nr:hypothetical protein [Acidisphaera sp.]
MKRRRTSPPLPLMLAELSLASWETIARRSLLMAQRTCSPLEYSRMVTEKAAATAETAAALARGASAAALLAPWHSRATANAKRLRKRRG